MINNNALTYLKEIEVVTNINIILKKDIFGIQEGTEGIIVGYDDSENLSWDGGNSILRFKSFSENKEEKYFDITFNSIKKNENLFEILVEKYKFRCPVKFDGPDNPIS